MTKFNKSFIMVKAWELYKSQDIRTDAKFSECLKLAWSYYKKYPIFDILYKEYKGRVLHQISQTIKNNDACEDICTEVFMKVNRLLSSFTCKKSSFNTWVHRITTTMVVDYSRTEGKKALETSKVSDLVNSEGQEAFSFISDSNASGNIETEELNSKINSALNKLKPIYKQIAEMFYVKQYSYTEIAEELNIPMGTVKGTLLRAKVMLQNSLQSEYQAL